MKLEKHYTYMDLYALVPYNDMVKTIGNNTEVYNPLSGENIEIRLHDQHIVTLYPNGAVQIRSRGYQTRTTKDRINRFLPIGYYLYQKDFDWYISTPDSSLKDIVKEVTLDFKEGMIIK